MLIPSASLVRCGEKCRLTTLVFMRFSCHVYIKQFQHFNRFLRVMCAVFQFNTSQVNSFCFQWKISANGRVRIQGKWNTESVRSVNPIFHNKVWYNWLLYYGWRYFSVNVLNTGFTYFFLKIFQKLEFLYLFLLNLSAFCFSFM